MYAAVNAIGILGITGYSVKVEVDIQQGLPTFDLVGLLGTAVREAKQRVRAAIANSSYSFPLYRMTVNLAPANMHKDGPGFDLAIAVAILAATGEIQKDSIDHIVFLGELSLKGELCPVSGILPMVAHAKTQGFQTIVLPLDNLAEAMLIEGIDLVGVDRLEEVAQFVKDGIVPMQRVRERSAENGVNEGAVEDFIDIRGQKHAKRGLEIAAAGGHNVLMIGPPGSGKTMLASRMPTILPPLEREESLVVAQIHSVVGTPIWPIIRGLQRPFRCPHHTITIRGLIGGGVRPRPGEISLAHTGVLFLDELPEFRREVIDAETNHWKRRKYESRESIILSAFLLAACFWLQ